MVLQPFLANGSASVDLVRLGAANREAVALCFAVSCCAGYAFHENQEFWSQSLRLDMDSIAVLATGELGYAFPPVVLSPVLSADPASRFAKNEDYLRGFFGLRSGVVSTPSKHFVLSMEMLGEYMLPERRTHSFQVTLKTMSLDKCLDDLQRVVALVNEVFRSITMAAVQFRVTVHSIRIDKGPSSYAQLQVLMEQVPVDVQIEFPDPYRVDERLVGNPEERSLAFRLMVGVFGTEWTGRLRQLDVTDCKEDCFEALCSLLPFSQSLQLLLVAPSTTTDWLWLGYALFHPHAHHSQWKTLDVSPPSRSLGVVYFEFLERCKKMSAWSQVLAAGLQASDLDNVIDNLEIKTATVRTETAILHWGRSEEERRATLPQGYRVDVCDDEIWAASQQYPSRMVDAIAPGFGVGRIRVGNVEVQPSQVNSHPPVAVGCLTALHVPASFGFDQIRRLAWLLTPGLEELTIKSPLSQGMSMVDVAKLPPTLTTIKGCNFTRDCLGIDLSLPAWRNIQSLEITCTLSGLVEPLVDALIKSPLRLKYVLLRVSLWQYGPYSHQVASNLREKLQTLPLKMPHLLALSVSIMAEKQTMAGWDLPTIPRGRGTQASKLAFISVMRQAQASSMSLLGADVLHQVFAFVGHCPDYFLIQDGMGSKLFSSGRWLGVGHALAQR